MEYKYDDGGREAAGFKGTTGDCACRAISIATGKPYEFTYAAINHYAGFERTGRRKRGKSNARTGVYRQCVDRIMKSIGWHWTPTMQIGSGCKVHLKASELPAGNIVVVLSKHYAAVKDGVLHDNHDSSRNETRCVYGYYSKEKVAA